jgi:uncharacterized protein involved in outer membrane biogenesis
MLSTILKVIATFLAVGVLLIGSLALALSWIVDSDKFETAFRGRVAQAFGTPVEWQSLEATLLPPRITINQPALVTTTGNSEDARLTAKSADLRLALLPIFERRIEVDSLVLHGVELAVTRTSEGLVWPFVREEIDTVASSAFAPAISQTAFALRLRSVVVSESRIILRDHSLERPVEWRFEAPEAVAHFDSDLMRIDLVGELQSGAIEAGPVSTWGTLALQASQALDGPTSFVADFDLRTGEKASIRGKLTRGGEHSIQIAAVLALSSGGRVDFEGTSTREGVLDVHARVESFDLALAKNLLPDPQMDLAGLATGLARVVGDAASPEYVSIDVEVESGLLRMPDYFVEGSFLAELTVTHPLSGRPMGQLDLDLTSARVEYQDQFKKPAGMRAEMTTKFETQASGKIDFESRIKLREINEILEQSAIRHSTSLARHRD